MHRHTVLIVDRNREELEPLNDLRTDAGYSPVPWWAAEVSPPVLAVIRRDVIVLVAGASHGSGIRIPGARLRAGPPTKVTPLGLSLPLPTADRAALLGACWAAWVLTPPIGPTRLLDAVGRVARHSGTETRGREPMVPVAGADSMSPGPPETGAGITVDAGSSGAERATTGLGGES